MVAAGLLESRRRRPVALNLPRPDPCRARRAARDSRPRLTFLQRRLFKLELRKVRKKIAQVGDRCAVTERAIGRAGGGRNVVEEKPGEDPWPDPEAPVLSRRAGRKTVWRGNWQVG